MHELYTSKWTALGASALTVIGLTLNTLAFAQPRLAHPPDADKAACFSQMDQVDLNSCIAELRNARADIQKGRTPDVPPRGTGRKPTQALRRPPRDRSPGL